MQNPYAAVDRGSPRSAEPMLAPFVHFQTSESFPSAEAFLIVSAVLSAGRQSRGASGHASTSQTPADSLQSTAHGGAPALHTPAAHVSAPLQNVPSEHDAPSGFGTSAGHASSVPVQVSAASQASRASRHTVSFESFASVGHAASAIP